MAKTQIPMTGGGGKLPKLVGMAITLGVFVYIVKHPVDAAEGMTGAFTLLSNVIDGLASFLSHVHG